MLFFIYCINNNNNINIYHNKNKINLKNKECFQIIFVSKIKIIIDFLHNYYIIYIVNKKCCIFMYACMF